MSEAVKSPTKPIPPVPFPCARSSAGGVVRNPPDLYSSGGKLTVELSYQTIASERGPHYCFMTPDGMENPTLHVSPGETLTINLTNNVRNEPSEFQLDPPQCGAEVITDSSVNVHFHGLNISPACHSGNVIRTMVNWGQVFTYTIKVPQDDPPGLYLYHPGVHGLIDDAMLGGATGAIVVEGIEQLHPEVDGLEQRILLIRDQNFPGSSATTPLPGKTGRPTPERSTQGPSATSVRATFDPSCASANNDLSINFIDVGCPTGAPAATIQMKLGAQQFWRVVNASGDDVVDLQVRYDGVAQAMRLLALDGTPLSKDSTQSVTNILLAPGNRAEFLIAPPELSVRSANLVTLPVDDGPDGANYPQRTLAAISNVDSAMPPEHRAPRTNRASINTKIGRRFAGLADASVTATRKLYFSEDFPGNPRNLFNFFITVDGATPTSFYYNDPPAIVTYRGATEEWTIENRSMEGHVFHIHQIHFLVEAMDNFPGDVSLPYDQNQLLDTIFVPGWSGIGPYPAVKLKMDFRSADIGEFIYHCNLAFHEDNRMIAAIEVTSSRTTAVMRRMRNYLASLRWFSRPRQTVPEQFAAWCVAGRAVKRGFPGATETPAKQPTPVR